MPFFGVKIYQSLAPEINNEFCSYCHEKEYDSLMDIGNLSRTHSSLNCTDCHGIKTMHKKLIVDFEICLSCHTELNDLYTHDENTTGCFSSECHNKDSFDTQIHTISD